jgi:hypothetical protein
MANIFPTDSCTPIEFAVKHSCFAASDHKLLTGGMAKAGLAQGLIKWE